MHKELIINIRSIKQKLGIGIITTINGTDHHLMNQLDKMEELVNENFGLADVSNCSNCSHTDAYKNGYRIGYKAGFDKGCEDVC
jgi:flagellar biosynthesis/type III secretory pathway protein FliH